MDIEDVLAIVEGYIARVFKDVIGTDVPLPIKPDLQTGAETYGTDADATAWAFDISAITANNGFPVFAGAVAGGGVGGIWQKRTP